MKLACFFVALKNALLEKEAKGKGERNSPSIARQGVNFSSHLLPNQSNLSLRRNRSFRLDVIP